MWWIGYVASCRRGRKRNSAEKEIDNEGGEKIDRWRISGPIKKGFVMSEEYLL
jgi:hypothetical protein